MKTLLITGHFTIFIFLPPSKTEKKKLLTKNQIAMRKIKFIALFVIVMVAVTSQSYAQAPYRHSVGETVGTMVAFTYKTFPTDHFAMQFDLGTKYNYNYVAGYGSSCWSMEIAQSYMYEGHFVKGLYGFVGGGISLGISFAPQVSYYLSYREGVQVRDVMGKFGAHSIVGLEYKFDIPLTLQLDVRPGYRFLFNNEVNLDHTFDWGMVNFGVRYAF